jgi:hypothetical protein
MCVADRSSNRANGHCTKKTDIDCCGRNGHALRRKALNHRRQCDHQKKSGYQTLQNASCAITDDLRRDCSKRTTECKCGFADQKQRALPETLDQVAANHRTECIARGSEARDDIERRACLMELHRNIVTVERIGCTDDDEWNQRRDRGDQRCRIITFKNFGELALSHAVCPKSGT